MDIISASFVKTNNFFVFGSGFDYCDYMIGEAIKLPNFSYNNCPKVIQNKLLLFLKKIHMRLNLPFKQLWYKKYFDFKKTKTNLAGGGYNFFVFFDSNPLTCDIRFLSWLKKNIKNSVLVIYFCNSMSMRSLNDPNYFRKYFDLIYSYDFSDAQKYGFNYFPQIYSPDLSIVRNNNIPLNDIFFVGAAKGREKEILSFYEKAKQKGLKLDFTVVGSKEKMPDEINTKRLSYKEVIKRITNSRCILEISNKKANGLTLRFCEAITFNKFLITDNAFCKKSKYYNPSKIRLIDLSNLKDNDCDMPSQKQRFDYKNDFSFYVFLEEISRNI